MLGSGHCKRILVEGLPLRCRKSEVEFFFSKWGPLSECTVMFDKKSRRCRGFGFISFMWEQHADNCLREQPLMFNETRISVRVIDLQNHSAILDRLKPKRILVSFLGKRLSKDDLEEYFSKFGAANVELAEGEEEGCSYYAFVNFEDDHVCRCCTGIGEHFIKGHRVYLRLVIRKEALKVAEQAERERAAREEREKADQLEEQQRSARRNFYKNITPSDSLAMPSACVAPPAEPIPTFPVTTSSCSSWVALLPSYPTDAASDGRLASVLAGYGDRQGRQENRDLKRASDYDTSSVHAESVSASCWVPIPTKVSNSAAPVVPVTEYSAPPQYYRW